MNTLAQITKNNTQTLHDKVIFAAMYPSPDQAPSLEGGRKLAIYLSVDTIQDQTYAAYLNGQYIWEGECIHYDLKHEHIKYIYEKYGYTFPAANKEIIALAKLYDIPNDLL